ncbi:MAG: glucose-6-phosphate dehydrogenase [Verrucomicrobiota bacterium]
MGLPEPCLLVIFGASGDLTRRKLVPSLYALHREKLLPEAFAVLGVSRTRFDDASFRERLLEAAREELGEAFDRDAWAQFCSRLFYHPGDILDAAGFPALRERVRNLCAERGIPGNLLFYLSLAPKHYAPAVAGIGASGLATPEESMPGYRRVVIEKPFGNDLGSARTLSEAVAAVFREDQVYRIDHYLGKETVQNLLVFRFANGIFEPVWNRNYIDHVQITVAEDIGVGSRGDYYDGAGAVRDMLQNHLLQLLALVAMEPPISLSANDVRDEKLKLLRSVEPISSDAVGEACVRGQYAAGKIGGEAVPAYRTEKDVPPGSLSETFVAARFTIDNWRWGGVPFYLRSGKRLAARVSEIAIRFRPAPYRLFEATACGQMESNLLVLNLQPDEGIFLQFGAKSPGPAICVQPVQFRFSYEQAFGARSPSAYGRLLLDAMLGDATLFPRADIVDVSWALLEPFLARWRENPGRDLYFYPGGSWGPREADDLLSKEGRAWRMP